MKLAAMIVGLGIAFVSPAQVVNAANPPGTGQPGLECGDEDATSEPPGFASDGFAVAEEHYAGSDGTPSLAHGSDHAVSQYDVACFQFTSAGH
jgi:hypothetical protein